jgi:hypothetical protein
VKSSKTMHPADIFSSSSLVPPTDCRPAARRNRAPEERVLYVCDHGQVQVEVKQLDRRCVCRIRRLFNAKGHGAKIVKSVTLALSANGPFAKKEKKVCSTQARDCTRSCIHPPPLSAVMARRRRRRPPGGHTTAAGNRGRRAPFFTETATHTHTARSLACPLLTRSSARPFSNGIFRSDGAPASLPPASSSLTHTRRTDGFCNQNADQLGSLAGLSFPVVYVGVVECTPASLSPASSSLTHTRRTDGFCNQNAYQLGSLAGLSFPVVYVGVVEYAPAFLSLCPPPSHIHAGRMVSATRTPTSSAPSQDCLFPLYM